MATCGVEPSGSDEVGICSTPKLMTQVWGGFAVFSEQETVVNLLEGELDAVIHCRLLYWHIVVNV